MFQFLEAAGIALDAIWSNKLRSFMTVLGNIVRDETKGPKSRRPTAVQEGDLKPGQERKELEGVFVVRDNKAVFVPVKTGIAGEKYFEVLSGAAVGDQVIIGPFSSVRELHDGGPVKIEKPTVGPNGAKT